MNPLRTAVTVLVIVWILVYIVVYIYYFNSSSPTAGESSGGPLIFNNLNKVDFSKTHKLEPRVKKQGEDGVDNLAPYGPTIFLSEYCQDIITVKPDFETTVSIVIAVRNEDVHTLLATVESVMENSGPLLSSIVIVDDYSDRIISDEIEWKAFIQSKVPQYKNNVQITVERLSSHKGVIYAKNKGAKIATEKLQAQRNARNAAVDTVLVFLDSHVLVSDNWLGPLVKSLHNYPKSAVSPTIDVINGDAGASGTSSYGLIKSDDVVAAFDWALSPRWEPLSTSRIPKNEDYDPDTSDEVLAPSLTGIFAIKSSYFKSLGAFDIGLHSTGMGHENIELSLRIWLCGGIIVRQSCSRVAHRESNLFSDQIVGNGGTQAMGDYNVVTIANKWFYQENSGFNAYREVAFQARFLGRIPYSVETSTDSFQTVPRDLIISSCSTFQWYLAEVYPGLRNDVSEVESNYRAHLSSDYLAHKLESLIDQYKKTESSVEVDLDEVVLLRERQETLQRSEEHQHFAGTSFTKHAFIEPPRPKSSMAQTTEEKLQGHTSKVRDELLCADFVPPPGDKMLPCATRIDLNGKEKVCSTNKAENLFMCPQTCGYCDSGKFCEDHFLNKCVNWMNEGLCKDEEVANKCRKSCGKCTPDNAKINKSAEVAAGAEAAAQEGGLAHKDHPLHVMEPTKMAAWVDKDVADPHQLHKQFLEGRIPDVFSKGEDTQCALTDRPNGRLLSKVNVHDSNIVRDDSSGVRVFCGIYTMEKNHETNVKATTHTWAKRCDGFMAFSTKADPAIPSVKLDHEGEESYDNMWQKSRSIWKYVAANYADQFDYFLLGGDDMLYIVENLKQYLASPEIKHEREARSGLFIGRVFQPPNQVVFNSGGAGYLLDRKALKVLAKNIDTPKCYAHQHGFWEDVNVANCLKKSDENIVPYDTRDTLKRERFHPFTPGQHLDYRIPKHPDWYAKYNPELKVGYDCCSDESISFHYVKDTLMYNLHDFIYNCPKKQ